MDKTFNFKRFMLVVLVVMSVMFIAALTAGSVFWSLTFGISSITVAGKLLADNNVNNSSKI